MDKWKIHVNAAIVRNNKLLVAKRPDILKWELLGGIEDNEQPLDTAVRKLKEELDLEVKVVKILTSHVPSIHKATKDARVSHITYLVNALNDPVLKPESHTELMWLSKEDISTLYSGKDKLKTYAFGIDKVFKALLSEHVLK